MNMDSEMSETVQASDAQNHHPKKTSAAFERCLQVLKAARSDTEVFAALLLVTKLLKAEQSEQGDRRRVFEAVGFKFLNRLLKTEIVPQSCDDYMFQSLAVTLLACFSTDPDLLHHPEMLDKIPVMGDIIARTQNNENDVLKGMTDDAYEFIVALTTTETGREELCKMLVPTLIKVIQMKLYANERALGVLSLLLNQNSKQIWDQHSPLLDELLGQLGKELNTYQDKRKFEVCDTLSSLMSSCSWVPDNIPQWTYDIHLALYDVLRCKLGVSQRDVSLQLASSMLYHYGIEWSLGPSQQDKKFLFLLVNLASVEIRMILEDMSEEEQSSKAGVLCCCYVIIEKTLEHVICQSSFQLDGEELLQIHRVISEAMAATTYHLKCVADNDEQIQNPVLFASVRALCMWLAEETTSLSPEIEEILPFLMKIGKESIIDLSTTTPENIQKQVATYIPVTEDVVRLLLPALCHMTIDKKPQRIFLEHEGIELLNQYLQYLWRWRTPSNKSETESSMITLCNILLNIVLQESSVVPESESIQSFFQFICKELPHWASSEVNIATLHLCLAGLSVLRLLPSTDISDVDERRGVVSSAASSLHLAHSIPTASSCLHPSLDKDADMAKELICLILQFLSDCTTKQKWIAAELVEHGWLEGRLKLIEQLGGKLDPEILSQYNLLICSILKNSDSAVDLVLKTGGAEYAKKLGLSDVAACMIKKHQNKDR